jgi:predicted enzyme related to lactoylglutathione lyase
MHLPAGAPRPAWLGYLPAPDMEASVARFTAAGGRVIVAPWDIPQVGRLVVLADPQGAALAMIQPAGSQPSEAFNQALPGHGNWHELHVPDPEAAFAFYAGQFGWTADEAMPMGDMGVYQIFKDGDAMIGGMMRLMGDAAPAWLFYFGVEQIDAAVERVTKGGGTILHGPAEVPGGAFIVQALDPQGAAFAVVGPR